MARDAPRCPGRSKWIHFKRNLKKNRCFWHPRPRRTGPTLKINTFQKEFKEKSMLLASPAAPDWPDAQNIFVNHVTSKWHSSSTSTFHLHKCLTISNSIQNHITEQVEHLIHEPLTIFAETYVSQTLIMMIITEVMGGGDDSGGREGSPKFYIYNSRSTCSAGC